jgi:hypothetical protein
MSSLGPFEVYNEAIERVFLRSHLRPLGVVGFDEMLYSEFLKYAQERPYIIVGLGFDSMHDGTYVPVIGGCFIDEVHQLDAVRFKAPMFMLGISLEEISGYHEGMDPRAKKLGMSFIVGIGLALYVAHKHATGKPLLDLRSCGVYVPSKKGCDVTPPVESKAPCN